MTVKQQDVRHLELKPSCKNEYSRSGQTETFVEHKSLERFLINTHAFHNAHLIRAILPRQLTIPIAYAEDRQAHHDQIAAKFRLSQEAKRLSSATAAKKNAEKEAAKPTGKGKKRQRVEEPPNPNDEDDDMVITEN